MVLATNRLYSRSLCSSSKHAFTANASCFSLLNPSLPNRVSPANNNSFYNANVNYNYNLYQSRQAATSSSGSASGSGKKSNPGSVYSRPTANVSRIEANKAKLGSRKTKIENIAEEIEPIRLEVRRRFISRRTGMICLLAYFVISFSCLGYVYYHGLPPSRLMYVQPIYHNLINPERAHILAVKIAQWPRFFRRILGMINAADKDESIQMKLFEGKLTFPNPIGLAAGFDKHGECIDGMLEMGFGFVEIGTVTPKPQLGNEKPRVFRLLKDQAIINRYGFNSHGHDMVRARLELRIENMDRATGLLGVNLGKNKETPESEAVNDYIEGVTRFVDLADYLVINVSSPNTPGLRDLQRRDVLKDLLSKVKSARNAAHDKSFSASLMADCDACRPPPPPLLVKIAPDLDDSQLQDIAIVCQEVGIDGIIVTNTTIARPDSLRSKKKLVEQKGGLSGKPIFDQSNEVLKKMYKLTDGKIPLIGVGGISSARDAYKKIKCGASLVQLYSGLTFAGPVLLKRMIREIGQFAELDGILKLEEAIGVIPRMEMGLGRIGELTVEEKELVSGIVPRFQNSVFGRLFGVIKEQFA